MAGHKAVYWLQNADSQKQKWDRYAEIRESVRHAGRARRGPLPRAQPARRQDPRGRPWCKGRPGHDEFSKFLSPYGRFSSYRNPDGSKVPFDHCPTVEECNEQKIQIVGSIDDAVDAIGFWRDLLDLKHICFFFDYPGLTREEMTEQMHLVAEEVFPRLGEPIERRPLTRFAPRVSRARRPAAQSLADDGYLAACRRSPSRTPTSTRPSWPSGSPTRPAI